MSRVLVPASTLAYQLISSSDAVQEFCQLARSAGWFAIDTEFVRQKTYYAKLGLLQAHAQGRTVIIDPLAEVDLAPLWDIICSDQIITVLHAGGEDIELFFNHANDKPRAIFDTQIAAGFCGLGSSMGYAKLVEQLCGGVELDKSLSRTDWLRRPLTPQQLDYAAADASYLSAMYPYIEQLCRDHNVLDMVLAESEYQVIKRTQVLPDELLYLYVGNAWQLNAQQLGVLQHLAAWRQQKARKQDMPLGFIFKDGVLLELARKQPTSDKGLHRIMGLPPLTRKYSGREIVQVIEQAQQLPDSDYPPQLQRLDDMTGYKQAFKKIKAAVNKLAEELNVDPGLVASRKQMNDFLNYHWQFTEAHQQQLPPPDLQRGWRWQHLEKSLAPLMSVSGS